MNGSYVDSYAVLGLDRFTTEYEDAMDYEKVDSKIGKRYRFMALSCHPDHAKSGCENVSLFHAICEAYTQIKDRNGRQNFKNNSPPAKKKAAFDLVPFAPATVSQTFAIRRLPDSRRIYLESSLTEFFRVYKIDLRITANKEEFDNILALSLLIEDSGGSIFTVGSGKDSFESFCRDHPSFTYSADVQSFCKKYALWGLNYTARERGRDVIDFSAEFNHKNHGEEKKLPCRNFNGVAGSCVHGSSCGFSHAVAAERTVSSGKRDSPPPGTVKRVACKLYDGTVGSCPRGDTCNFDHTGATERTVSPTHGASFPPQINKKGTCKFYNGTAGSCSNGEACGFYHTGASAGYGSAKEVSNEDFGRRPCSFFAKGKCKNGTNCPFSHGTRDSPPRAPKPSSKADGFDWGHGRGHRKVIVIGGTGHGKSTFINSVHNFFRGTTIDTLEAVIPTNHIAALRSAPQHSEAGIRDPSKSQTMDCNEYVFKCPMDPEHTSITLIDTPGLG